MTISQALHHWYRTHGRKNLPWRTTRDAYHIWLSEIMLQQTQVKTVLAKYYFQFLEKFPTVEVLANATEDSVLKAWEGLGYYQRARNFHAAAKQCTNGIPQEIEQLQALPGIGKNTAHAIACFAFGKKFPVMEANVRRILFRLLALESASEKELFDHAAHYLDRNDPFTYNQAMMDIGALICTKKNPKCGECPLSSECKGKNAPENFPKQKQKPQKPIRARVIIVIQNAENKIALYQREQRFLQGLFAFPEYEKTKVPLRARAIASITQEYSHFRLEAEVQFLKLKKNQSLPAHMSNLKLEWYEPEALATLALSRVDEKVRKLVVEK